MSLATADAARHELQLLATNPKLLERLRRGPDRTEAWSEFVVRYGPHIYRWCLCWNAQPADAADVVQEVLTRLVRRMSEFRYDEHGSFRSYLKTLARYAWCDLRRDNAAATYQGAGGGAPAADLAGVVAREDLERRLQEEFDRELLDEAMRQVAARVTLATWEAFRLQAVEGMRAAAVALRLGMPIASVYKARSNVIRLLRQTVHALELGDADPTAEGRGPALPSQFDRSVQTAREIRD
jgi:RNA polymerase sigma-70 factor (ECF subfamily)